jgi:hypothetical protein
MQTSGSYLVVETMIRQNKVVLSELEQLVSSLEKKGLITSTEQRALIQLAIKLQPKQKVM